METRVMSKLLTTSIKLMMSQFVGDDDKFI